MPDVNGAVRTDWEAKPRTVRKPDQVGGSVRHMFDEYTCAALAAASKIKLGVPLPIGARIKNVIVFHEDLGSTNGTIAVGDAGNAARYLSAFATGSAGKQSMEGANGVMAGWFYQITGNNDTDIIITTAGNSLTGKIMVDVEYVVD